MATKNVTRSIPGRVLGGLVPLYLVLKRYLRFKHLEHLIERAEPKHPDVIVYLPMGHPEFIMQRVCQALRDGGVPPQEIEEFIHEALSQDYGYMLLTVARWVTVP